MPNSQNVHKIQERLKVNAFKLESLLEITKAINNNVPQEKLFSLYENILKKQLNIGKLLLYANTGKWHEIIRYGLRGRKINLNVQNDLLSIQEIKYVTNKPNYAPFDVLIPVFHKNQALAYVLIGDFDEEQIAISPSIKHLPFIQTLTNLIFVAVENKRLAKESIKQQALKKELHLARQVQEMLFPETLNITPFLSVAAKYLPHHQVGGDYYDFFKLNDKEFVLCIADVSGKGVSAALLMSNFQANLRALIHTTKNLTELIHQLNAKVLHAAKGDRFITFFIGVFNIETHVLNYINAAHLPPILVNVGKTEFLKVSCTGLGMLDELGEVIERQVELKKDSFIFLFTDGINELINEKGDYFSFNDIYAFVSKHHQLGPEIFNEVLLKSLHRFKGKKPIGDDITMLCCKVN